MKGRLAELGRRVWFLLNRSRFERELWEEMAAHRAMMGTAGPRFGNELRLREEAVDEWGWGWLDRLQQDVRFGARLLRRSPMFLVTAIAVLALGIGINLAAFQVFDAVALSPLQVRSPETLVRLSERQPQGASTSFSYPEFAFYRSHASLLSAEFALVYGAVELVGAAPPVTAEFVTTNYLSDLGARPLLGRLFDPRDERAGADPVVLLDERFWRTKFGSDPSIVGRPVQVNGHAFTIAGVVPTSFVAFHHDSTAVWIPLAHHSAAFAGSTLVRDWSAKGAVRFYARLRDGVSIGAAQAELAGIAAALHRERPADTPEGEWLEVHSAKTYMPIEAANGPAVALVAALVLLVLVAACTNLGVLVLARTLMRDREFGLRLSIGASRGRILRQLMTEHLMLGLLGAAVGCAVGAIVTRAFVALSAMPIGLSPHLSWRSTSVAVALALLSSIAFGFTPALQAIRPAVSRRMRLRSLLVAVQIATAAVLLIVSGLLIRSVTRVLHVPLGFDYSQVLLADPDLTTHGIKPAAADAYWRRVDARVRQVPGVVTTALTTLPPFGNRVAIDRERTVLYGVTASYFRTMGVPVLRGRVFRDGEPGVAIVSEALARRRWSGADPLGQNYREATVIGVVGDAHSVRVGEQASSERYLPIQANDMPEAVMVVRTVARPRDAAAPVMSIVKSESTGLTPSVQLLADALEGRLEGPRRIALMSSTLGLTALLLAVIGLGGLIAYTVSQRTREIGVRIALGARPTHVIAAVARQFRIPILCGAIGGSLVAAAAGTILSSELFGVSQFDPIAHGAALLLFAIVAALAALPAVRRAVRVDPVTTLRAE